MHSSEAWPEPVLVSWHSHHFSSPGIILSRYTLTMLRALTLRRRPAVTLPPARTPLEQRPLSPDVIAPLPWPAADQVVAAGAPLRSSSSIASSFTIRR